MYEIFLPAALADDIVAGVVRLALVAPSRRRLPDLHDPLSIKVPRSCVRRVTQSVHRYLGAAPAALVARIVFTADGVLGVPSRAVAPGQPGAMFETILEGLPMSRATSASCLRAFLPLVGADSHDSLYSRLLAEDDAAGRRHPHGRVTRWLIGWGALR